MSTDQVVSCNWHRTQTIDLSADSDVSGYFVLEYMGHRSGQVRPRFIYDSPKRNFTKASSPQLTRY